LTLALFLLGWPHVQTVKNPISICVVSRNQSCRRGEKIFATKEDYWSFVDLLEKLDEVFKKLERERDKFVKQQVELQTFDEKLRHYADQPGPRHLNT